MGNTLFGLPLQDWVDVNDRSGKEGITAEDVRGYVRWATETKPAGLLAGLP